MLRRTGAAKETRKARCGLELQADPHGGNIGRGGGIVRGRCWGGKHQLGDEGL